jgi:hypothetical protein
MAKATESNTTNRRALLSMAVAIPAVMAPISLSADADPIFAAIDRHQETAGKVDTEAARLVAVGLDGDNWMPMQAALLADCAAGNALIETAPNTRAGLRALDDHLRKDRNRNALWFVKRPILDGLDGRHLGFIASTEPEAVDWLIAKHAAEIAVG